MGESPQGLLQVGGVVLHLLEEAEESTSSGDRGAVRPAVGGVVSRDTWEVGAGATGGKPPNHRGWPRWGRTQPLGSGRDP